jgi:hypothetical protein
VNTFVVVAGRGGRPVPAGVLATLRSDDPGSLAYEPESAHHWVAPNGAVAAAAWQLGAVMLDVRSRWAAGPGGVTTFVGHLWPAASAWGGDAAWADQLAAHLAGDGRPPDPEAFEGFYALAHLDRHGHGFVHSDPLGMRILYHGQNADISVVSSRAELVATLLAGTRRPTRDVDAAACLAFTSYLLDERTGFADVRALPVGTIVVIDAEGARTRVLDAAPWLDGGRRPDIDLHEAVPEVSARIRANLRTTSALCRVPHFELTGGKDSRLVLAHALAEGVAHHGVQVTWGSPGVPDVEVARILVERFALITPDREHEIPRRHEVYAPPLDAGVGGAPVEPADPRDRFAYRLDRHLTATSGASSSWDLRLIPRRVAPRTWISGLMGEAFRSIHASTGSLETWSDVERYVRHGGFNTDPAGLLRPEARRHHQDRMLASVRAHEVDGGSVQDAIDGFYLTQRLRRWFGALNEHEQRNRTFPLYSMLGIRTAFAIGHERRHGQVLVFALMEHAWPELTRLPFAGSGWPALALAGVDDPSAYPQAPPSKEDRAIRAMQATGATEPAAGARPRSGSFLERLRSGRGRRDTRAVPPAPTPRPAAPGMTPVGASSGTRVENVQLEDLDHKVAVLLERLDVGPDHPLHDIVDLDALRSALVRFDQLPYLERRSVHDAATAVLWLS